MRVFEGFPSILRAHLEAFCAPNVLPIWSMIVRHAGLARSGSNIGFHWKFIFGSGIGGVRKVIALKISVRRKGFQL